MKPYLAPIEWNFARIHYHSCFEAGSEPETPARRVLVPNRIANLPTLLIRPRQSN
jgi:hypothetical protein